MTDITELTSVQKNANIHRLSRLIAYAPNDELRQLAVEVEQYTEQLIKALEKAQQSPIMPLGLHPDTQKLVADFCTALAEKLHKAQLKYGYDIDWKQDGWPSQCQAHFHQHIAKGDPRDVAAYCAFMWWHGWSTKPAEGLESRTVTVKLPADRAAESEGSGYDGTEFYRAGWNARGKADKDALTAQGIKWEAE